MKFFSKKTEPIEHSDDWWKDPRLDDEGTYDYYVEELPHDSAKWERYYCRCDSCGKERLLNFRSDHYFYCWDGWDSMTYIECWRCMVKDKLHHWKYRIKKELKAQKEGLHYWDFKKSVQKNLKIRKMLLEIERR